VGTWKMRLLYHSLEVAGQESGIQGFDFPVQGNEEFCV
jgi:hypothetical protein